MNQQFDQFKESIAYVREMGVLYAHLKDELLLPNDMTDLLRGQLVNSISALDRLVHELVRIGMLEAFSGVRSKTVQFEAFALPTRTAIEIGNALATASAVPPATYWFETEVMEKHKHASFQDPDKISAALNLIWGEQYKWQFLGDRMGLSHSDIKARLKTIVSRRNQIVHEADIDANTGLRNEITVDDTEFVINFIEDLGTKIFEAVRI